MTESAKVWLSEGAAFFLMTTYRIHIAEGYSVRFTGEITRWQRLCLWAAGIDVEEVE